METSKDKLDRVIQLLWGLALVCLPVTSFPFLPLIGKDTQVRPLSIYPMVVLFPLMLLQMRRKRIKVWQTVFTPLAVFLLLAFGSTLVAAFYAPLELHSQDYLGRVLRAVVTIVIGISFFVFAIWNSQNRKKFLNNLKWLYLGLFISFLWGVLQLLVYRGWILNEEILDAMQKVFSISGISLKNLRIPGFAFEPSWLAGQMAIFYLPWLFASILTGFRLTSWRWLEFVLAGMAIFLLVLTYSRSGLMMVIAASVLTMIITSRARIKQVWNWWIRPFKSDQPGKNGRINDLLQRSGLLIILLVLVGLSVVALGRNPYFAKLWKSRKSNLVEYAVDIYAGPRLAYAIAGLETFGQHPWTGVGLGAGGMYLYDNLPDWSKTSIREISIQLSPASSSYPNSKNLFIRILVETGIPGVAAFVGLMLFILARILTLGRSPDRDNRFLLISGIFSWIVITLSFLSQDSFAMPTTWINFGLLLGLIESGRYPKLSSQISSERSLQV